MFEIGQVLDNKYKILEHIGTGGGGIVYKAYHSNLKKTVAIKEIKDEVADVLNGFAGANILKDLKNDYVPTVYDFIVVDGKPCTVMEFIDGESLQKLIDSKKSFSQKKILKYSRQLCEAVAYLHSRKPPIIHCDIKPDNVMLTSEDNICLIDYNISLIFDGDISAIGVTDGYSPPEQYGTAGVNYNNSNNYDKTVLDTVESKVSENAATMMDTETLMDSDYQDRTLADTKAENTKARKVSENAGTFLDKSVFDRTLIDKGKKENREVKNANFSSGKKVDERSDIYSIGATLYALVTGVKPAISTGTVKPIREYNSNISESLAVIIDKAMQKDPAKRFQSAEQMLGALNDLRHYDKRYNAMLVRQEIAIIAVVAGMALSGLTAVFGYSRLDDEVSEQYISYVNEMDNAEESAAEEYYNKAVELAPNRAEAYEKMAVSRFYSENYSDEQVIDYIQKVIEGEQLYIGSESEKYTYEALYYILGGCYLNTEEYELAASAFEKTTILNSNNAEYYYAVSLAKCGEAENAENVLEIAINKGLADENVLFARAEIGYIRKEYRQSIENFQKCIELTSDETLRNRAYVDCVKAYADAYYEKSASCDECTEFYNTAIEKLSVGNKIAVYETLAKVNMAEGEVTEDISYYETAISAYEKLIYYGYSTSKINSNLVLLYKYTGNYSRAKEYALSVLKDGDDCEIYKRLAFVELDIQNDFDQTNRDYTEFSSYYKKAKELYENNEDFEMQRLDETYAKLIKEGYIKE